MERVERERERVERERERVEKGELKNKEKGKLMRACWEGTHQCRKTKSKSREWRQESIKWTKSTLRGRGVYKHTDIN